MRQLFVGDIQFAEYVLNGILATLLVESQVNAIGEQFVHIVVIDDREGTFIPVLQKLSPMVIYIHSDFEEFLLFKTALFSILKVHQKIVEMQR